MRKNILTLMVVAVLSICLSSTGGAEDNKFKIQDYIPEKFKDFEWLIEGGVDLDGSNSSSDYDYPPSAVLGLRQQDEGETTWRNSLRTSASYRYETIPQFYRIDLALQGGFKYDSGKQTSFETRSDYPGTRETESKNSGKTLSLEFSPSVTWGKYHWGDLLSSIEVSSQVSYSERPGTETDSWTEWIAYSDPYFSSVREESNVVRADDTRDFRLSLGWMAGWGRIYEGVYASTAVYMIEELKANGALLRDPTKEEMLLLCDLIYQNRLKHAVDERIRRIEVFDEILSYLNDVGLTDACDNYGYLLISDVWDYFPQGSRQYGFRVRAGFGMVGEYYRWRETWDTYGEYLATNYHVDSADIVDTTYRSTTYEYYYRDRETSHYDRYLKVLVEYSNPLTRQIQFDVSTEARYYTYSHWVDNYSRTIYRRRSDGSDINIASNGRGADIDYRYWLDINPMLKYYYNSRTWFGVSARYIYDIYRADEDTDYLGGVRSKEYNRHRLHLMGLFEYRLSIPTTLEVMASYTYDQPDELTPSDVYSTINAGSYSLSISLSHYLY